MCVGRDGEIFQKGIEGGRYHFDGCVWDEISELIVLCVGSGAIEML